MKKIAREINESQDAGFLPEILGNAKITDKDEIIKNLQIELMKTVSMYNAAVGSTQDYLKKYNLPVANIPFKALKQPNVWNLPSILNK